MDEASVTVTLATETTAGETVKFAAPAIPSDVAVIAVVPEETAETRPVVALTVATAEFELLQVTVRPMRTFPWASLSTTVGCIVEPIVRLADGRITLTEATGAGGGPAIESLATITAVEPRTPPIVAEMRAPPVAMPLTIPVGETVATTLSFVLHQIELYLKVSPR